MYRNTVIITHFLIFIACIFIPSCRGGTENPTSPSQNSGNNESKYNIIDIFKLNIWMIQGF